MAGDYYLIQWEDGTTFYLEDRASLEAQGHSGTMEGAILRIGWSDKQIVLNRGPFKTTTDTDWMTFDVGRHEVQGPFSDEEFAKMKEDYSAVGSIKICDVKDAWEILR